MTEATYRGRALLQPRDREEWRAWLAEHHATANGAWVARWTRSSGNHLADPSVGYAEMVEEALCFGWIDGVVNRLPDGRQAQLLTPRRRGSGWARSNKERVERLVADGRMTAAGQSVIDAAKADGSWSMQDDAEALVEPADLAAALDGNLPARANWDAFPASPRRALIWWVMSAKRPDTRARRVTTVVSEAAAGRRANY